MNDLLSRRTLTVLIADVEGSTRLQREQPEDSSAAVARISRIAEVAATHGGLWRTEPRKDGTLEILFGRPGDAVAAALALQREIAGSARLRIGVDTVDVQHGDEGYEIQTVNRATLLRDLAHGGQTLLSRMTTDFVLEQLPAGSWLIDLGVHALHDQSQRERVAQLCHTDLRNEFPPLRMPKTFVINNLSPRLTSFIGRRDEMEQLLPIVAGNRLVTLTGAGGIGKTRLAIALACQIPDGHAHGVYYVDLTPIADPVSVPVTVAHALGIPDKPGNSALQAVRRFVGSQEMTLLLDNCEHILDACGTLISALIDACPRLTVLTTSREPIGVVGERTWTVPPLSLTDDAIELFTDRARHARSDFRVSVDDVAIIADICRRLDGMPLAIELAAARVRALSLAHIRDNLQDRFQLLTGGARTALPRHQTLRASVDWSHALMTEPERRLFRRLGVFPAGFDLEAAQAVGAGATVERQQIIDHLPQLVDKSLVVAENVSGAMRYRLLETMREYAVEKLCESGEADVVRDRHRDYYVDAINALASLVPGGQQHLIDWAHIELDNLRAAYTRSHRTGDTQKALRLTSSLRPFWIADGRLREGMAWFDDALPPTPGPDMAAEVWVRAVVDHSTLAAWLEAPTSLERARTALSIARKLHDRPLIAATLNVCSVLTRYDAEASRLYLDEAADLARASNDGRTLCETLLYQAIWSGGMAGDPMVARIAAEECRDLADTFRDPFMSWGSRIWLGNAMLMQGDLDDASGVLVPLVEQNAATGHLFMSFFAGVFLGRVRAYQGQPLQARTCWEMARKTANSMGGFHEDTAYAMLAEISLAAGDWSAAKEASGTSWRHTTPERTVFNRVLNPAPETLLACGELVSARRWADDTVATVHGSNKVAALTARAHIASAQGEPGQAARDAHDALVIAADTRAFLRVPDALECLARLAVDAALHQNASRLLGAAARIRNDKGISRFPMYQSGYDAAVQSSRNALGERAFDAARTDGAALSIDEVVAYVRRGRGKRKRPVSGWESLTPTEADVARLVREGFSNKDIAARMLISHRTVQTHLTHVYAKLGLTSRVQLVQEAARHT